MKKKGIIAEFKEFISRGNVIDLAIGFIMGTAFTAVVTSVVNDIIMPFISLITGGMSFTEWNVKLGTSETAPVLGFGNLVAAALNFFIIALVVFAIVKTINTAHNKVKKPDEAAAPTTKICPYCKDEISIEAVRCPHCTSILDEAAMNNR